jgi:hypothetical protein
MHSPRFKAKIRSLSNSINEISLADSWKKKVRNDLKRQIIPDAVEYLDIHVNIAAHAANIASDIRSGNYIPSHVTRLTSEKSKGLCRIIVIPDPTDAIILQVLADSLWIKLRKAAPSQNSFYAPKDHAFSKMKYGLENEYGPIAEWIKFQKAILGFSNVRDYIIVTDIANYYDWIRYTGLRAVLNDIVDTKEVILDVLIYILKAMIWRPDYMPNDDLGLPQADFDAPRMLAHTFLYDIDGLLENYPSVDFARYMDDIDIGVDDMATAKKVLRDLDLTLQSRHIRLNSGKTQILDRGQAIEHFCVRENTKIDRLVARIEKLISTGQSVSITLNAIPHMTLKWHSEGVFNKGNGQKILKRLINYSRTYGIHINSEIFQKYFINSPAMRETFLRFISKSEDPIYLLYEIEKCLQAGEIVDDVTIIRIANAITTARYTRPVPTKLVASISALIGNKSPFSVYAQIKIDSRFGDHRDVYRRIMNDEHIWRTEPVVVRFVAGMTLYLRGHHGFKKFKNRMLIVGGKIAVQMIDFIEGTVAGDNFSKIRNFIKAPNQSYVNGITHEKFGMILGFLSNSSYSKGVKANLLTNHPLMMSDYYYSRAINRKMSALP